MKTRYAEALALRDSSVNEVTELRRSTMRLVSRVIAEATKAPAWNINHYAETPLLTNPYEVVASEHDEMMQ